MALKIITTADGSHSLLNEELNETYHSVHGAVQESLHVFIKHGLEYVIEQNRVKPISIFEVGFGTGLNALLTLQRVEQLQARVNYTTVEAWPLGEEIWSALSYISLVEQANYYMDLHRATWDEAHLISPNFSLLKLHKTLQAADLPSAAFHLVYYDAFAPTKQPELWELPMLEKISNTMQPRGIFVTYCAKGQLKRDLIKLGFKVETLPGAPGKKEMVRAVKL